MISTPLKVLVCGTGNAAHVAAATLAHSPHYEPTLVSLSSRGTTFLQSLRTHGLYCNDARPGHPSLHVTSAHLNVIGPDDLSTVTVDAHIMLLAIPSFAHETYLRALLPYCPDDILIMLMPTYGWGDLLVRDVWLAQTRKPRRVHVAMMEQLPWVCRTQHFGRSVTVFAHKRLLTCSIMQFGSNASPCHPDSTKVDLLQHFMKHVYSGELQVSRSIPSAVALSLFNPNAMMHATLMYGFYQCPESGFTREVFQEPPPFYHGVSMSAAALLDTVSAESLLIKEALIQAVPNWSSHLSQVSSFHDWIRKSYADTIKDSTTTASCLQTNQATLRLPHPMVLGEDGHYRPDYTHRYLSEDVPCGLLPLKSLAQVLHVPTVTIDKIISWAQKYLNESWLQDGRLTDRARVAPARTLQRFGIFTTSDLQEHYGK